MGESLRVVLAFLMITAGMAMCGYAGYLWYAALPEERTRRQVGMRVALAFGGVALLLWGSQLLT